MSDTPNPETEQATTAVVVAEDHAPNGLKVTGNINISGEEVQQATLSLPDDQRDLIRWFYANSQVEHRSLKEAAALIKVDTTTLYRVWRGIYGAKPDKVVERIYSFKRLWEERQTIAAHDFVETSTAKAIWRACDYALVSQTIGLIYGKSQTGKTFALEEYARRNNHGQTKLIRMPASGGVQLMMKEIAHSCFVSCKSSFEGIRERVLKAIDGNNLVIIDEIHQVFLSYQRGSAIKCLEVLREIHDRTKCGMILCGTNVWEHELKQGSLRDMLEQLRRRGAIERRIDDMPSARDVVAICKAFGLPQPEDDVRDTVRYVLKDWGLGRLCKYLQAASRMAAKEGTKLNWHHFTRTHDILAKLANKQEAA